jgi:hypothetical protein
MILGTGYCIGSIETDSVSDRIPIGQRENYFPGSHPSELARSFVRARHYLEERVH